MDALPAAFWESGAICQLDRTTALVGFGRPFCFAAQEELEPHVPAFYFPDFFLREERPWIQFDSWKICPLEEVEKELTSIHLVEDSNWEIEHADIFQRKFQQLKELITEHRLAKGVPYTFAYSSSKMTTDRLKQSLKKACTWLRRYPLHLYGFWHKGEGVLGLTPEILFLYDPQSSNCVQTMALAGTKRKGEELAFLGNEKEEKEHQLVVQGIRQSLIPFGEVSIFSTRLLQLPTLTHLFTPIEVSLNQSFDFAQLVKALHPTPALGAFPLEEGWKWLNDYQTQLDRKFYGAPVGYLYPEKKLAACYVSIRQVQWNKQGMRIGAGCGVVKESQYEQEWEEVKLKIKAIRDSLAV